MAVPTVVGVGSAAAGTGTVTPTLPSGWAQDDILLLFVENYYNEKSTATGYTQLVTNTNTTPNRTLTVLWKRAGASESDPTVSDSGDFQIAAVMAVRGCPTTGSPFGEVFVSTHDGGATRTLPAIKTYVSDCLYIGAVAGSVDNKTTANYSNWTNANLTSVTEQLDYFSDAGSGGGLGIVTGSKSSAGDIAATSFSQVSYISGVTAAFAMIPDGTTGVFVRGRGPASASTGAITADVPYGVAENDILVALVETSNQSVTITNYTEAGNSPASNSGTNPTRLSVFYKRAGASETTASVSDSGDHQTVQIVSVVGAKTTGDPFNATASTAGGTGTTATIPGATTSTDNTLVLAAISTSGNNITSGAYTNANLSGVQTVVLSYGASGNGGAIGLAVGTKASAGSYGDTTKTITSAEWTAWSGAVEPVAAAITLSADSGTLTLTGADADFGRLFAADSPLTLTGGDASLYAGKTLGAEAGVYTLTGQNGALAQGRGIAADAGALTLTQQTSSWGYGFQAQSSELTLADSRFQIRAANPAKSELSFLIDLVPAPSTGNYQRYAERLYVGGTEVPLISWQYAEGQNAVGGKLQFEIADVSQRSLFTSNSSVVFEVGTWNGSGYTWTSLLDTGALENSQYSVRAEGGGARETFSVSAMSEMEDRLNTAPSANVLFVDPGQNTTTVFNIPAVINVDGSTTAAQKVEIADMDLHSLLHRIFVTECGFGDFQTNLPNFRIYSFDCEAGVPYTSAVGGLVGMFNPSFSAYRRAGTLVLSLTDGTVARSAGLPSGRTVTVSAATAIGLSSEFVNDGVTQSSALTIGGLELTLNRTGLETDYQSAVERSVTETIRTGTIADDENQYTDQTLVKTYLDRYDSRYGNAPYRSDLVSIASSTEMTKKSVETYQRPTFALDGSYTGVTKIEAGQYETFKIEDSYEKFVYENGELSERWKEVSGCMPMGQSLPGDETENTTGVEYYTVDGDRYYPYEVRPMTREYERIVRAWHPFVSGRLYISSREVVTDGLVTVDDAQTQAGRPFMRPALEASRAGNLVDGQTLDWVRISSVYENYVPNGDGTVNMSKTEHDYLAEQTSYQEGRVDDGQIGYNARSGAIEKKVVTPDDQPTPVGRIVRMNAGPLPLYLAVAVGRRRLRLARIRKETFSLEAVGIDATLQQGSLIEAYGVSGEHVGTFVVEARTLSGSARGYTMTLQARTAS